jgi:hypothetical protein
MTAAIFMILYYTTPNSNLIICAQNMYDKARYKYIFAQIKLTKLR